MCAGVWEFGNNLWETETAAEDEMKEMEEKQKDWRRNFSEQSQKEDAQDSRK